MTALRDVLAELGTAHDFTGAPCAGRWALFDPAGSNECAAEVRERHGRAAALCALGPLDHVAACAALERSISKLHPTCRRLTEYGIRTGHNTSRTARGYRLEDFHDAFERYLPPATPSDGVQAVHQGSDQAEPPDTLDALDTMKASSPSKASGHNRRSEPERTPWTPSDTTTAETCPKHRTRNYEGQCGRCSAEAAS